MKFSYFDSLLRRSLFVIQPARYALKQISDRSGMPMSVTATLVLQSTPQGRRVFCGSLFNFLENPSVVSGKAATENARRVGGHAVREPHGPEGNRRGGPPYSDLENGAFRRVGHRADHTPCPELVYFCAPCEEVAV